MLNLPNVSNCAVVANMISVRQAMNEPLCRFIVFENSNAIFVWSKKFGKWHKSTYIIDGEYKDRDFEATGFKAYREFYRYCGQSEVEKMKNALSPIPMWESCEQMHYANIDYVNTKIYEEIYEFDANSSFTYGVTKLPRDFDKLKDYMYLLYNKKKTAENQLSRSYYKNMQNFLIGYFARIKQFVRVRSDIISNSNFNIKTRMAEILQQKGKVYLSNTDSIVTDKIGASVMQKYIGTDVGEFKLSTKTDKLYYRSSNAYQIGEKIVWSGMQYFARKDTDFFNDRIAKQTGKLVDSFDYYEKTKTGIKLCRVREGEIKVEVVNTLGELITIKKYKIT